MVDVTSLLNFCGKMWIGYFNVPTSGSVYESWDSDNFLLLWTEQSDTIFDLITG